MATLTRKINIISRCYSSYRAKQSACNLPGIYHSYVLAVCRNPGWSQDMLARHLCLNKSNVTRHLAYLEDNGYIERRTGEKDKREMLVYPTEKMMNILPEITAITKDWNEKMTAGISEEEYAQFMKTLEKMTANSLEIIYGKENRDENSIRLS